MAEENKGCTNAECTKESCEGCEQNQRSFLQETSKYNSIKRVVGVVSGKGGVGKSFVTAMLAILANRKGYSVGILDADITGPSIPKMFGITGKADSSDLGIFPALSKKGIHIMSTNLLLPEDDTPVIWRGPLLASAVKQFWTDVLWGELDYLFIDLPPGTGDVPLTVFQSIPLSGVVIVTSPQELVGMIVRKAYHMAMQMNIPVLGVVENMSYVQCPHCGEKILLFGESKLDETAAALGIQMLGKVPVDPAMAALSDAGKFEDFENDYLKDAISGIESMLIDTGKP